MGKQHELLAVEETIVSQAEKMLAETSEKFAKHSEFFTGHVRTLARLKDSVEDKAMEAAARKSKNLPTSVPLTLSYIYPFMQNALNLKLSKHMTNQVAKADIELDGKIVAAAVPVDFLLDLEKMIPRWRAMYAAMPTLDPSRQWSKEADGVFKSEAPQTSQTEKIMYPVVMAEATDKHPAQVKEATKDIVVGTFSQTDLSGAATTQQKADVLALCDRLLAAVKQARMRANSTEAVVGTAGTSIIALFSDIFSTKQ